MFIHNDQKFVETSFESERELEKVVEDHSEEIFGPSSLYLPKKLIRTTDGIGTIPDGFTIDIEEQRWFIIEAELDRHSVWSHIAPQIAKQASAITQPESIKVLKNMATRQVKSDESLKQSFLEEGVDEIDIRKSLDDIFAREPIIGIPINRISGDLQNLVDLMRFDVRLWTVRKYREFDNPDNVMYELPEEYEPTVDTTGETGRDEEVRSYDVSVMDLIEEGYLEAGQTLYLSYKPRGGERHDYEGKLEEDGSITVDGETFSSPSYSSLYCIQDAGSDRTTDNGWRSWENEEGKTLEELREEYLKKHQEKFTESEC